MLIAISALKNYAVEASDGMIGHVEDFLFDDLTWKIRWLVVETGVWLTERKVMIPPSSVLKPDHERELILVALTKAQIEASPPVLKLCPVSSQIQSHLYTYYGSDPLWGNSYFAAGALAAPLSTPAYVGAGAANALITYEAPKDRGDPNLRSIVNITGYHLHATDGEVGHVENFMIDDGTWEILYLLVDTRNWWPGPHVLISPYAVHAIGWADRKIRLDVNCAEVKSSPPWDPIAMLDGGYGKRLHSHYGWPDYAF